MSKATTLIGLSTTLDVKMDPTKTVKARKRKPAVSAPALLAKPSSRSSMILFVQQL